MPENRKNSVKLKKIASGQVVVGATVNGVKGVFVLDTGAGNTILDISKKDKFKIADEDVSVTTETAVGAGASGIALQLATLKSFSVALVRMKNTKVFLMNLDNVNFGLAEAGIRTIDGMLGGDILFENNAVIDYSNLSLTFNVVK